MFPIGGKDTSGPRGLAKCSELDSSRERGIESREKQWLLASAKGAQSHDHHIMRRCRGPGMESDGQ